MIWVRRFFVLPVGAAFLVLLALMLFGSRVSATFYDPEFYNRHLGKHDVYGFFLGDLPAVAMEEMRSKPPDYFSVLQPDNLIESLDLSTTDLVDSINRTFPLEWTREQVEEAIDRTVGYLNGSHDEIEVAIAINERVPAATHELKSIFGSHRVHSLVLEHYVAAEVDEAFEDGAAPLGARLDREDVIAAIDRTVPEEWLSEHVDSAIDEISAYMSRRQETLEIHVPLYERADVAIEELNALFAGTSLDSDQLGRAVAAELEASLPALVQMPFGVALTAAEVADAVERAPLPGKLSKEQSREVVASAAPYIVGVADDFRVLVPTTEIRASVLAAVEALARERLEARLTALRPCEPGETPFRSGAPGRDELLRCSPAGTGTEALLDMMDVDVAGEVERLVGRHLPESVEFTRVDLRRGMGREASRSVLAMDRLRILFGDGWTYTEAELLEDWTDEEGDGVEDLRSILSEGWSITLGDSDESQSGTDDGSDVTDVLDQLRSVPAGLVSVLVLAALLAAAGLLGGQNWRGRLAWASATLAVASILLFLVLVASVGTLLYTVLNEVRTDALEEPASPAAVMAVEKAMAVAGSMVDEFMGGLVRNTLGLFVVGVAGIALSFVRVRTIAWLRR